jgi:hypothetical protein
LFYCNNERKHFVVEVSKLIVFAAASRYRSLPFHLNFYRETNRKEKQLSA